MTVAGTLRAHQGADASRNARDALAELLADVSMEATPRQLAAAGDLSARFPRGTEVYLPFLPGSTFTDSVESCRRLDAAGMRPVPHIAARAIADPAELDAGLAQFVAAGVDSVLLIAGDLAQPVGCFDNTLDVLDSGLLVRHGIHRVGVAGHPEGHPIATSDALLAALRRKVAYARATGTEMWLVTQFIFAADAFPAWEAGLRDAGIDLPIRIGLPGPASIRALAAFALQCGVAVSARVLARRPGAARLLTGWTADETLGALAAHWAATPNSGLAGIHIYPFGGLAPALAWLERMRTGTAAIDADRADD